MSSNTILLVEDNEDDVFLMQFALKSARIFNPLHVVEDGERAVDYLSGVGAYADRARFPYPGLVFLDVKLPYMTGFDVLEWMHSRSDLPRPPVVVLSSSNSPRDIELAARFGADYAIKPPTAELFERVANDHGVVWVRQAVLA
jgi:CheY-like chemotaxis protein